MKAIIMAGGEGTRLRPLTCNVPKPMMPILDKPVMEYAVDLLRRNGITDIGVTLQYLPDEVVQYFGDGKNFGVNFRYFIEEYPLGTAGSVKNAEEFLDDTFIVISGDALTDIDLSKAIEFHKKKRAAATLILKEVAVPLEYGVVVTNEEGRIQGFIEKPSWGEVFSDKANTGIYILEPGIFSYFEKDQKIDFSNDVFPMLLNQKRPIYGYVAEGYWCDIGNIEQYMNCHYDILKGIVKVEINGEEYKEGVWVGKNCEIDYNASLIPPVFIGANCKIYSHSEIGPFSILGKNNIVSIGATIRKSVIFDNCYIGNHAEIRGAVLCNKVQLGTNTSVFEETAIGDETLVGDRSIIKPGVKIWPNKVIDRSTVVKSNIIWGGKFSKSLFGKRGISGEVNVDITPEIVSKLGSAYGSLLKTGGKVCISCTDDGAAQMFKYSLATGLLSMGIEVYDLKRLTTPMARHATFFFGVQGGIHVIVENGESEKVTLLFMDSNGLDIDRNMERKIENSFIREDFRRIRTDSFKKISHMSECLEFYFRQVINQVGVHTIRKKQYRAIISTKNPMIHFLLSGIFEEVGIYIISTEKAMSIDRMKEEVLKSEADFGVMISEQGEYGIFVDENGEIIKDELYEALSALVLLKSTKLKTFVAPVTASLAVEYVANFCGAKFVRTKSSQKSIIETYIRNEENMSKKEILANYLSYLDAITIAMLLIQLMATSNTTLSSILKGIPRYHIRVKEVSCPWDLKGKVMRNLIEGNHSKFVDLIEGVKLNYDDAWALVLPDADEPVCRVYAESQDYCEVERLSEEIARQIGELASEVEMDK